MLESERLPESKGLVDLLAYYAERAKPERQAWQDRLMELDGLSPRDLTKLHGELIAYGWVEQNTGLTPGAQKGGAPGCYRSTAAGRRALVEARSQGHDQEEGPEA
jgi:hypothetical protein